MESVFNPTQVLSQVFTEVQRRFNLCHDLAHGWDHVNRVYTLAQQLARSEGADHFIVSMAALLHDLGQTVKHKGNSHHADLSSELAAELLNTYQVPIELQQAILHAILAHSFSRGLEPLTLEARVVRDADRLDALGAIGIMRWGITGAQRATPRPYQPDDPFAEQRSPDDHHYMLDHFYAKLLTLADTMTTSTGRQLAQQRTTFMHNFLSEFKQELTIH